MKTATLRDESGEILHVCAEIVGFISTWGHGRTRWTDRWLYLAEEGGWVVQEIDRSIMPAETSRYRMFRVDTDADLVAAMGQGWAAHRLYQQAGIENFETLD